MRFSRGAKDRFVRGIREELRQLGVQPCHDSMVCFYAALVTWRAFRRAEVAAVIQAGDCLWPRVRPEQDDGQVLTHFGYEWHPESSEHRRIVAAGRLPEIHVWVGLPQTGEIVDVTTRHFVEQCRRLRGALWPGPRPPDYLWAACGPVGVIYRAKEDATAYVLGLLAQRSGTERPTLHEEESWTASSR